ncbi:MAG: apolipoprotein N-acyltransferase [Dermatophilaceae bacterium]
MSRLTLAIASGLALWLAFPSHNLWVLAPVGVALLALATRRARPWRGALLGLVSGMSFFLPLLSWSGVYVGAVPWIALATLESAYIAVLGLVCALLQRSPSRAGVGRVRPVVVALAWVAEEALRDTTPFGGFPWGRLAFSQADSPLAGLAALGGAPAVTFGVALVGGLLAAGVARLSLGSRPPGIRRARLPGRALSAAPFILGAIVVTFLPALVPRPTDGATARFMAVQGDVPRPGLDFNAERRAVLDNHVRVTRQAAASVRAGSQPRPDMVVWPENASDIDPLRNADAATVINQTVDDIAAPLVLGAVLDEPRPSVSNASLLYLPGKGLTARYVKQHPVPFAEYIPYRSFFRRLNDKVDLVRSDFVAGKGPGVFRVPVSHGGTIAAGTIICFEVAYDGLMRDTVNHGANVLLVQTNNATFGFTDESAQQLAISRIRAIEHGRSVVHVSTVGVSAMITPDGTAHQSTRLFTPALLAADLPLRTDRTLADRLGAWPESLAAAVLAMMLILLGLGALAGRVGGPTRTKDGHDSPRDPAADRQDRRADTHL